MPIQTTAEQLIGKRVIVRPPSTPADGKRGRVGLVTLEGLFRPAKVRVVLDDDAGIFDGDENDIVVLGEQHDG